jgi:hypothetical protein
MVWISVITSWLGRFNFASPLVDVLRKELLAEACVIVHDLIGDSYGEHCPASHRWNLCQINGLSASGDSNPVVMHKLP